jgi:hypothetical protein
LNFPEPNATPLGTVIAAPPPAWRELFCRNGLKHYERIAEKAVRATLAEVEKQHAVIHRSRPTTSSGKLLALELDLAARMAAQSCRFMLWQQALAAGGIARARKLAESGIRELNRLEKDFNAYWPLRNKATTRNCSAFLRWRREDYRRGTLPFGPVEA